MKPYVCAWVSGMGMILLLAMTNPSGAQPSNNIVLFSNPEQMQRDVIAAVQDRKGATNTQAVPLNEAAQEWVRYLWSADNAGIPKLWMTNSAVQVMMSGVASKNGGDFELTEHWDRVAGIANQLKSVRMMTGESGEFSQRETLQYASLQINRTCAGLLTCEPMSFTNSTDGFERFINEVITPSLMQLSEQVEHKAKESDLINPPYSNQMMELQQMVVAIGKLDDRKRFVFSGSGFLVRDRLFTCAHVIARYFIDPATGTIAERITIAMIVPAGIDFTKGETIEIEVDRRNVFPEIDIAVVELTGRAKEKALEVDAKLQDFYTTEDFDDPMDASVFMWGVENRSGDPKPVYGIPEPIYFPASITKRAGVRADPLLGYAYRHHYTGLFRREIALSLALISHLTNESDLKSLAAQAFMQPDATRCGYTKCSSSASEAEIVAAETCKLVYIPKDPDLLKMVTNSAFVSRPRIECFGIGLYGIEGMSGAPVFRLINGRHRLVGVYAGISEPNRFSQKEPTLDCFGKAIPFDRIKNITKK